MYRCTHTNTDRILLANNAGKDEEELMSGGDNPKEIPKEALMSMQLALPSALSPAEMAAHIMAQRQ